MVRIAMIGTRGVPARYGGFETCVEEVGGRLADRGHDIVVYCRRSSAFPDVHSFRGMRLVHLPAARRRALETLSHSALSVAHLSRTSADVVFVYNAANSPLLPALRAMRIPVATHVDGLEWRRSKWNGVGRRYYRLAECLAVRWSDAIIADAQGIADYYRDEFGSSSHLISYGSPIISPASDRLDEVGVKSRSFHLAVARFEPENHVREIVEGYVASSARQPLLVVGSAPYSDAYTDEIHRSGDGRVRFLGGIWDQALLDQLYAHSTTYLHGHSVGGTNPSLLRAMGAGAATVAFDVNFNREVLGDSGRYFKTPHEVAGLVEDAEASEGSLVERRSSAQVRAEAYDWDDVASKYEALAVRLEAQGPMRHRPSGRRRRASSLT